MPDSRDVSKWREWMRMGFEMDTPKLQYSQLPALALQECAKGMTFGLGKHPDNNYTARTDSEMVDKILSHLQAFRLGEPYDEESGVHHLACVANNAMMLCEKQLQEKANA